MSVTDDQRKIEDIDKEKKIDKLHTKKQEQEQWTKINKIWKEYADCVVLQMEHWEKRTFLMIMKKKKRHWKIWNETRWTSQNQQKLAH